VKKRFQKLKILMIGQKNWINQISFAVQNGETVLIENLMEDIDTSLEPILSRSLVKRGRKYFVTLASEEITYDEKFQLYLSTKIANPHYSPEVAAQCTLINFMVTEDGLEEQLLALVVNSEKPELEETKVKLMMSINQFKIILNDLENDLLYKLSNAPDDILSDVSLIEGLEQTKATSVEIDQKLEIAKVKEIEINNARNEFRGVAAESSWIFFTICRFNKIQHLYQYSLSAFKNFFFKGIRDAEHADDIPTRAKLLCQSIRLIVFKWVCRGLFEKHKLIWSSQLCFLLMKKGCLSRTMNNEHLDFLLSGKKKYDGDSNPVDYITDVAWYSLQALALVGDFQRFVNDLSGSPGRFKEWYLHDAPESIPLPLDWRKLDEDDPFAKICIIRCLRPDRLLNAVETFTSDMLPDGKEFTELDTGMGFLQVLSASMDDADNATPVFFILSPGSDPVSAVRDIAKQNDFLHNLHAVSMGQGQDIVAMKRLDEGHKTGTWVCLENIHLMPKWCRELEKKLDTFAAEGSHPDFRLYLSAEPSNELPVGILERSIKLTQEPPQGIKANLKRAFASFDPEEFQLREGKVKTMQFTLCLFHAVLVERKKFGPKGWNCVYPFSIGDLTACNTILVQKLEANPDKIPWADFRYIFGEIMYGGHITDDLDRLLCMTYLKYWIQPTLLDDMELVPYRDPKFSITFICPPPAAYHEYFKYIDEFLVGDNPRLLGLHPNSEILVRTEQTDDFCQQVLELQPRDEGKSMTGQSAHSRVKDMIDGILDKTSDLVFDMEEVKGGLAEDERGPYQNVFLQEIERMNRLLNEIITSLNELNKGMNGELTMSWQMEELMASLTLNILPASWKKISYPSLRGLGSWIENMIERCTQLQMWVDSPTNIPRVIQLSHFFNPQSFLTAIMQTTAQRNNLELDKLQIISDVTRKTEEEVDSEAREGAYVTGLSLIGCRWDLRQGILDESLPREMYVLMPVINCKAVLQENMPKSGVYFCPVFQTQQRGPTFVFTATLKTKHPAEKWILAGVAAVMEWE